MMTTSLSLINTSIKNLFFPTPENPSGDFKKMVGKKWVLYFYPKDNTPGCTQESLDFKDMYDKFLALNTDILGISRDNEVSHEKFKCLYNFPFELVSDTDEKLCSHFGVLKNKNLYGRLTLGVERSTFLVNEEGLIVKEWRKVKVNGHATEVLQAVEKIK